MTEFEEIRDSLQSCRFGSFIIIPLKYSQKEIKKSLIDEKFTVFGIISILESILSIIQLLDTGTPLDWSISIATVMSVILIIVGEFIRSRK